MTPPRPANDFDPTAVPLEGTQLVNASAGTGKTHGLALLVLRVLLETPWTDRERENPLRHVLAVTYTKAATAELGERVRRFVRRALAALADPPGADAGDPVRALVLRARDRAPGAGRTLGNILEAALMGFDEAAVHTIHSFCQLVLREYAFESGTRFDAELAPDPAPLLREVVLDFWRREVASAPLPVAAAVAKWGKVSPDDLLGFLASTLNHPDLEVRGPAWDPKAILAARHQLDAYWKANREACCERYRREKTLSKFSSLGEDKVAAFAGLVDRLVEDCLPNKGLFSVLEGKTFSDASLKAEIEAFGQAMASAGPALRKGLWHFAGQEFPRRKEGRNLLHYGDLLTRLRDVLRRGDAASRSLRDAVRRRYRAVFVDEFQDTDPVQYEIFRRLFAGGAAPVFFIGDPKQSIYRFRGADIEAYLHAEHHAAATWTLRENRRSTEAFVAACNRLYAPPPAETAPEPGAQGSGWLPFGSPRIGYEPVAARGARAAEGLWSAEGPCPPLVVWHLGNRDAVTRKEDRERLVVRAIGEEIAALTSGSHTLPDPSRPGGRRAVHPGDVAVLVRAHYQGEQVRRELARRGIAAVQGRSAGVFGTAEATELLLLLSAVADPTSPGLVRTALLTSLMGVTVPEQGAFDEGGTAWETWLLRFHAWNRLWRRQGFGALAEALTTGAGVRRRLLGRDDALRRVTNLTHLLDLLQSRAGVFDRRPGEMLALLDRWVSGGKVDNGDEEAQLRLESDAQAVRVLTVFVAKGLEFPVVFSPFHSRDADRAEEESLYHAPAVPGGIPGLVLDLAGGGAEQAASERWEEDLRLFYVAVTRAVYRAYLYYSDNPEDPAGSGNKRSAERHMLGDCRERFAGCDKLAELRPIRDPAPAVVTAPGGEAAPPPVGLARRSFQGKVDTRWGVYSFTRLSHSVEHREPPRPVAAAGAGADPGAEGLFAFPGGEAAGSALHKVLEGVSWDLGADGIEAAARPILERFGLARRDDGEDWAPLVARTLEGVLRTDLAAGRVPPGLAGEGTGPFRLCDIPARDRVAEMTFHFPLGLKRLADLLGGSGLKARPGDDDGVRGLLSGAIDAVFRRGGRYYVLDWKSNRLGSRPEDYAEAALETAMVEHGYTLQRDLYALALHRHLRARLGGAYDPGRHVGGVFYLFLRGMAPGRREGILFRRCDGADLQRLDALYGSA
ncbi:MAG: UvrD-helicase domain-containing protein [Acidobacteria bacterium]|nr:UvrD-helicase domain-containing protein [Acidobacteriota bacterium]